MGHIIDPEKVSLIITQAAALARPRKIIGRELVIGLPEDQAFMKIIEMPSQLKDKELTAVLEHQWENFLPIPASQVYYDVVSLRTPRATRTSPTQRVLVVAYPKEIITSLLKVTSRLGWTAVKFMPLSFGMAALFSQPNTGPTLVLGTSTGQDLSVAVVHNNVTHFSTTIHAAITDAKCYRQLANIRTYYEKNIAGPGEKLAQIMILPSGYSEAIGKQVGAFLSPTTVAPIDKSLFLNNPQQNFAVYIPLLGLLSSKVPLVLMPTETLNVAEASRQLGLMQSISIGSIVILGVITYLSIVFYGALGFHGRHQTHYSTAVKERASRETVELSESVNQFNDRVDRLVRAKQSRHLTAQEINTLLVVTKTKPTVTVKEVNYSSDTLTYTIKGTTTSNEDLTSLIETLKQSPALPKVTITSERPNTATEFTIFITLPRRSA